MLDLSALALHACQVVVDNEVCSMLPAAKLSCRQVVVGVPAGQQLLACMVAATWLLPASNSSCYTGSSPELHARLPSLLTSTMVAYRAAAHNCFSTM